MQIEQNFNDTNIIIDEIEHNLNLKPNFKTLRSLIDDLNVNLLKYKIYIEKNEKPVPSLNKSKFKDLIIRIEKLENLIKSKLLLTKKYSEYIKF